MTGEILAVGTELLMGQTTNTNAQYLAQKLSELGINVYHQVTVGDNMGRLTEAIRQALERADLLLLTGGLGPTQDDLTKWAVAEVLNLPLTEDEGSRQALKARMTTYGKGVCDITENNYRQTIFPQGAIILPNHHGTAPGCICEVGDKCVVMLPGPPRELQPMVEDSVLPYLEKRRDGRIASRYIRVFGMGESQLETEIEDIIAGQSNPTVAPYAGYMEVTLRVTARVSMGDDPEWVLQPVVDRIVNRLGDCVYATTNESMQQALFRQLTNKKQTLAVAESLSGGMICDMLVECPGMSAHLLEGVICYSDEAKLRLGVSPETLAQRGAVSGEVAAEMAAAVRKRAGSDWGLATTGVAGPGPDKAGNPEGLYYVGLCGERTSLTLKINAGQGRGRIRRHASMTAMNELRKRLVAGK